MFHGYEGNILRVKGGGLFGAEQVEVLFAALYKDVLVVEQHRGVGFGHVIGNFLLVDAQTAALNHLAVFAFAGEYGTILARQQFS